MSIKYIYNRGNKKCMMNSFLPQEMSMLIDPTYTVTLEHGYDLPGDYYICSTTTNLDKNETVVITHPVRAEYEIR